MKRRRKDECRVAAVKWKSVDAAGRKTMHLVFREPHNEKCYGHIAARWVSRKDFEMWPKSVATVLMRENKDWCYVYDYTVFLEDTWLHIASAIEGLKRRNGYDNRQS